MTTDPKGLTMRNPFRRRNRTGDTPPTPEQAYAQALATATANARAAGIWAPDETGEVVIWPRTPGAHWAIWRRTRPLGFDDPRIGYRATGVPGVAHRDGFDTPDDVAQTLAEIRAIPGTDPLGMDQR